MDTMRHVCLACLAGVVAALANPGEIIAVVRELRMLMPCHARWLLAVLLVGSAVLADAPRTFRVWAAGDSHVTADIRRDYESLATPLRQSEGLEQGAPAFDWDIMIDVGDLSASQYPPTDDDGRVLVRQVQALIRHYREDIYNVPGNHDAPYYDRGAGWWFRRWADPLGENTRYSGVDAALRPFPVQGTWERYRFEAGNILFLMMSDRNDAPAPVGRGHSSEKQRGGFPAGAVTRATFEWWKQQVLDNQDRIIISAHHHMLRDTTMRSGYGEGKGFHGSSGGVEGSSYLYFIIEDEDPEHFRYTPDAHVFEDFLEQHLERTGRPAIDLWLGGHSHVMHPTQTIGGNGITEMKWGVTFINASALTKAHAGGVPSSRLLTFADGSGQLSTEVYLHERSRQGDPVGWYDAARKTVALRHVFRAPTRRDRPPPVRRRPPALELPSDRPDSVAAVAQAGVLAVTDTAPWSAKAAADGVLHISRSEQRVNLGPVDMSDWSEITVTARIKTSAARGPMRVVSKDRIGEPGNFMLWFSESRGWGFQAFDYRERTWRLACRREVTINDGQWHHIAGVVDAEAGVVRFYVDGVEQAEAAWTASTLDDSDGTDLVVGTDSGSRQPGHVFDGEIRDVQIHRRALNAAEIAALAGAVQ